MSRMQGPEDYDVRDAPRDVRDAAAIWERKRQEETSDGQLSLLDAPGAPPERSSSGKPRPPQKAQGAAPAAPWPSSEPLLRFFAPGIPRPKGSKSTGRTKDGRAFVRESNASELRRWMDAFGYCAREAMLRANLALVADGPLFAVFTFLRRRPKGHLNAAGDVKPRFLRALPDTKPDADKLCRGVFDALIGVLYRDDGQVTTVLVRKRWSRNEGCIGEIWFDHSEPDVEVLP